MRSSLEGGDRSRIRDRDRDRDKERERAHQASGGGGRVSWSCDGERDAGKAFEEEFGDEHWMYMP